MLRSPIVVHAPRAAHSTPIIPSPFWRRQHTYVLASAIEKRRFEWTSAKKPSRAKSEKKFVTFVVRVGRAMSSVLQPWASQDEGPVEEGHTAGAGKRESCQTHGERHPRAVATTREVCRKNALATA